MEITLEMKRPKEWPNWAGMGRRMRKPSQGMLSVFGGRGDAGVSEEMARQLWNEAAGLLEEVWATGAEELALRARAPNEETAAVLEAAAAAGVCSFAQTIEAARQFLLEQQGGRLHALVCKATGALIPFSSIRTLALNVVDEGHTAAVVRAEISLAKRPMVPLALLVARDLGAAAARLGAQASDLRVWHRMDPARAAEVLDDGTGSIRWFGQRREVTVVAARWVAGQTLRPWASSGTKRAAGMGRVLAGERRFGEREGWGELEGAHAKSLAGDLGALMSSLPGRRDEAAAGGATMGEEGEGELRDEVARREVAKHVARQLARTRSALATFALDGACERTIDVEQGDVLLDRHYDVVLVGSAARSWWGALGAWPYRLAGERVWGGASAAALQLASEAVFAGLETIARRPDGAALMTVMLQQAQSMDVARRALEGLVMTSEREPLVATVRELLPQLRRMLARPTGN